MKNILVLDTSTERAVVGLATQWESVHTNTVRAGRQHGRDLIPQIEAILSEANLSVGDLSVIGVNIGPGSYTGLRVGVTAAKTLAYATGAVLVALDGMHAIALNAPSQATAIAVIADAQRSEVYVADFVRQEPKGPLFRKADTRIESLSSWLVQLDPAALVMGPGLDSPGIGSKVPVAAVPPEHSLNYPVGRHLIELAQNAWENGRHENPWLLEPLYLRRSAAEDQWDARKTMLPA
jgi:tRNA threonylcarbamoyladenosine biosynthesis protein TsaB